MWFLSCDGDHLQGKSLWLRPGSKHLFGRTNPGDGSDQFHAITHKSVSRRHFELHVAPVEPGNSAHLHKRSKITIKDLGSKIGTNIDKERIKSREYSFSTGDHVIKLGNYDVAFRIKWSPMVFSFTGISRSARQSGDPLADYRSKVEQLDVKCITEFVANQTSHVITRKRNTPMALQALVTSRSIVTDKYLDAVQTAAERSPAAGDEITVSSLERDWDLNWPKELDYLPDPSSEPYPREPHDPVFLPNTARQEMFSKYVFIFLTASQYEMFLPVITGGGGKAILREIGSPESGPDLNDFLDFVKGCAGKKGNAAFKLSQHPTEKGGVVVVRPTDASKIAGVDFIQRLDLALDQRSVQQNEFLEPILTIDPTLLRRPLEVDLVADGEDYEQPVEQGNATRADAASKESAPSPPKSPDLPPSVPLRKRRNITRQKITTFDDFDPSQIQRYSPPPPHDNHDQSQRSSVAPFEDDFAAPTSQALSSARKRKADSQAQPIQTTDQILDGLLPGAAAMKKRKLEEANNKKPPAPATNDDSSGVKSKSQPQVKKRKTKEEQQEDLHNLISSRKEEAERRLAENEEHLRSAMEGVEIEDMRNLAVVEEMDIPQSRTNGIGNRDGWKPEWNGRPNWKRFKKRRPGEVDDEEPTRRTVIVSLEQYRPGGKEMDWGFRERSHIDSQSRGSRQPRTQDKVIEGNGMRRRRRATAEAGADTTMTEQAEDEDLRRRVEQSRIEDEREEQERENDVLDMGNVRDPEMRRRQQEAKIRERERRRAESQNATSQRVGLLSGLKDIDGARSEGMVEGTMGRERAARKRVREVVEDDDDDEEGGLHFRRRRRG
ncbi:hypothetical protein CAC42_402 [Sphaceloma murrayae]|uniref:FHA domain-containing protein n=1 Tax=Sphaceloma murrayae TaxID=2082308 RepID=A0A2K1R3D1_9PEZI|nr:hypothetical protein CAC42_402 [Sphaceloma murrayae]